MKTSFKLTTLLIALMPMFAMATGDYQTPTPTTVDANADANALATGTVTQNPVANATGSVNQNPTLTMSPTANVNASGSVNQNPTLNMDPTINQNQTGWVDVSGELNQNQKLTGSIDQTAMTKSGPATSIAGPASSIAGPATTNSGNISNNAAGGNGGAGGNAVLTLAPGSVTGGNTSSTSGSSSSAYVAPGAVQNTNNVAGGNASTSSSANATVLPGAIVNNVAPSASIANGAVQSTNSTSSSATVAKGAVENNVTTQGGNVSQSGNSTVKNSGNATIQTGAVQVNFAAPPKAPHAIATTPNAMHVAPVAPTSFYPIGEPNSVGAAGFVNLYETHCPTQISGEENLIRFKTDHEKYIATLDDQARELGDQKMAPKVYIVKPQQLPKNSGRCACLGTLQVESVITPEEARENNMQTVHAAAGRWVRENLRGFKLVQMIYSPQSVTFQKGTMAYASSKGIGGGGSATFGSNLVAMVTPSWGSTNGYSTDYPIVGVTYALIGSVDGEAAPDARMLEVGAFMDQLRNLPRSDRWSANPASPTAQAASVVPSAQK